jgi:hypothetical protein
MKAAADNIPRPIASTEELLQYLNIENRSEAHELVLTKFSELFREYRSNTEHENADFSKFDLYVPQAADNFISIADSTSCHLTFCTEYYYDKIKHLCSHRLIISGNRTGTSEVCLAIDQEFFSPTILAQASYSDFRTRLLASSQSMYLIGHTTPEVFIKQRMQLGGADLHIHTTASDSSDTPEEVCNRVQKQPRWLKPIWLIKLRVYRKKLASFLMKRCLFRVSKFLYKKSVSCTCWHISLMEDMKEY